MINLLFLVAMSAMENPCIHGCAYANGGMPQKYYVGRWVVTESGICHECSWAGETTCSDGTGGPDPVQCY